MPRTMISLSTKSETLHQIYWIDHEGATWSESQLSSLKDKVIDSIDQTITINDDFIEAMLKVGLPLDLITMRPGVTDNAANSFKELIQLDPVFREQELEVHSGLLRNKGKLDFNPLIQSKRTITDLHQLKQVSQLDFSLKLVTDLSVRNHLVLDLDDSSLVQLSIDNCWALSLSEMKVIQRHYKSKVVQEQRSSAGLPANPTDVEVEMLAQTWSEHCKHKIFNARIDYQDDSEHVQIESLFKEYIKQPTYDLNKDWAISVFDDNAGVVRFSDKMDLCIKVETHNSPSALDPYGGALTGILGVNRDILGTGLGAKPVANTDVFCVGMPDEDQLPKALIHPQEILSGIHRGVMDGGNKSGIPTVNGAIYFHDSYSGKPLVYCGTVGVLPSQIQGKSATLKGQRPGDLVVMVGGAVGIDGIHGATASSLAMDEKTNLGMVQIGDPFTQKRMTDFMLAARDKLLFNSVTDNGAGGLSSSVGEMAALTGGAILNLDTVPLKYPGLMPWQILVSESQERMTLSVPKENWHEVRELAKLYQVNVSHVGEFTNDGTFICKWKNKIVCQIDLKFLHDGLPKMELKARYTAKEWVGWKPMAELKSSSLNNVSILGELLSHPTIASKEKWVRQYDHEVQGASVVKPFQGLQTTAPNDAAVMWYGAYGEDGIDGFAVASGLCPHFSMDDTKLMAQLAVDEAVRNLICHGVDPEKVALVDNFCWPDPTPSARNLDAEYKLGQLVRACMGMKEMVEIYSMPLVSGKDSMKNDYYGANLKISVLPTLLVTALGHVPDVNKTPRSQARPGNLLYRVGLADYDQYFGHFLHSLMPLIRNNVRDFDWTKIRQLYQKIFAAISAETVMSVHDLSEGGFMVALFETLLMDGAGIELSAKHEHNQLAYLYSELPGHFLISVDPTKQNDFENYFQTNECELLGTINTSSIIKVENEMIPMTEMAQRWRNS